MGSSNGEIIYEKFSAFMPCYFRYINPVIHRFITDEYKLNENQIKVIMTLEFAGGATPTQLSRYLYMQKGSLTTIIRSLLKMELIQKRAAKNDERKYYLSLTEKGGAFVKTKNKNDTQHFIKLFERISKKDAEYISDAFAKLTEILNEMDEEL